jgi:uncharacterized protein (DUF885 family)
MVKLMSADEQFEKFNWGMFERLLEKNPFLATYFGIHEPYDWLVPDGSSKNIFETLNLVKEWLEKLKEKINFDALSDDHKIDWMVLEHAYKLFEFKVYKHRTFETNPDAFNEIGGVLFIMLTRDYAPTEKRVDAIVARLEKLPLYLEQFRTRFRKSKPIRLWTEIAIESCQRFSALLQFAVNATKGMISNELHARLKKSIEQLSQPLKQHLEWLKSLLPKNEKNWALGREKFEELLKLRKLGMNSE